MIKCLKRAVTQFNVQRLSLQPEGYKRWSSDESPERKPIAQRTSFSHPPRTVVLGNISKCRNKYWLRTTAFLRPFFIKRPTHQVTFCSRCQDFQSQHLFSIASNFNNMMTPFGTQEENVYPTNASFRKTYFILSENYSKCISVNLANCQIFFGFNPQIIPYTIQQLWITKSSILRWLQGEFNNFIPVVINYLLSALNRLHQIFFRSLIWLAQVSSLH